METATNICERIFRNEDYALPSCAVARMEHAGFVASLMRASRLTGDYVHRLPPGQAIQIFPIACLPGAPESWNREAGTYVCPVAPDWGLWFDWTNNNHYNTAILPSVKGMNPITGQKIDGISLEQYADKCPVHKKAFAHGRFCEDCKFIWPPQNYVSFPNILWWDGFRSGDGKVRQFFFSEEDARDIASAVIGKENVVPAFGFAFFRPKTPRVVEAARDTRLTFNGGPAIKMAFTKGTKGYSGGGTTTSSTNAAWHVEEFADDETYGDSGGSDMHFLSASLGEDDCKLCSVEEDSLIEPCSASPEPEKEVEVKTAGGILYAPSKSKNRFMPQSLEKMSVEVDKKSVRSRVRSKAKAVKDVAVGAGAEISQNLEQDAYGLDTWQEKPTAVIRLYFVFEEQFRGILSKGVKELQPNKEGYLTDLPVG